MGTRSTGEQLAMEVAGQKKVDYLRYALAILLLLPLGVFLRKVGLPFQAVVSTLFTVIPLVGLLGRRGWFFYYVYVLPPLTLWLLIFAAWFISLFGDQAYSPLQIALMIWPLLLYCVVVEILTVTLHVRVFKQEHRNER
jgi:hypothetical protein